MFYCLIRSFRLPVSLKMFLNFLLVNFVNVGIKKLYLVNWLIITNITLRFLPVLFTNQSVKCLYFRVCLLVYLIRSFSYAFVTPPLSYRIISKALPVVITLNLKFKFSFYA
ncbi:hypothetical protein GGTG_11534 [Gaeumannomyces tritici R3-111a-1]|uniref:Uncharacterized protein n=1 Tax=Gaeumannomyces tritici (strain R3-111a-1) TaxID=644352 RepID=J3PDG3_GAET3|nr:hypothetical protein GGTG_11534 [Gaeumannomyces tritici R3-111a-1]EJT70511.1 hypothetical protein GGTG_11534 [Gaeumannomyces tritici R3-111a-1]